MKLLLLVLLVVSGCAHVNSHCLTTPPPDVHEGAAECLAIPGNDIGGRINCGLEKINIYVQKSQVWQDNAWRQCGP